MKTVNIKNSKPVMAEYEGKKTSYPSLRACCDVYEISYTYYSWKMKNKSHEGAIIVNFAKTKLKITR